LIQKEKGEIDGCKRHRLARLSPRIGELNPVEETVERRLRDRGDVVRPSSPVKLFDWAVEDATM
jgi:hypothetical protein